MATMKLPKPTLLLTCEQGGDCKVGDKGPGGGTVFYDAGSRQSWGRYLEAAAPRWSGSWFDPANLWCRDGYPGLDNVQTSSAIGAGSVNTQRIITECGYQNAASVARDYRGGGKSDWYLPSKDELHALYLAKSIAQVPDDDYWSSTQASFSNRWVWIEFFDYGTQTENDKRLYKAIRPIRAF